ncbi:prenyltransferase/squalene oxidase repeat-containing protein [Methanobacterium formicicum]|uniref:prenyltransferase/squalene oxidase repeat-containing protein n=1 Tax=Methanobacterium formicicum TaxID=2162 RepID=UPI00241233AD|nr:prenyltransferase/squalene oxidase repeat-containing protein [Methanobacterium formicicum]MDG3547075.1 terpene cyclase/mutase family protein [Methanobacterium formicicum]
MKTSPETEKIMELLISEIKKYIVEENDQAYIWDPYYNIKRNRVNAEFLKTLIRLDQDRALCKKILKFIIINQNNDGSWNEVHPNYNKPSALITAIIGDTLVLCSDMLSDSGTVEKAKDYVLSKESNGFFLKSNGYTADHLNVDATCGAFLAAYGKKFGDEDCLKVAERTAKHIVSKQSTNGSFPYTIDKGNYSHKLDVPCIHYQGVTLYYLSKIHDVLGVEWLKKSLLEGNKWLSSVQRKNGKFDWSKSGLMFAYYLSGAYGFAYASFLYMSALEHNFDNNAYKSLMILKKNVNMVMLRWETDRWINFPYSIIISVQTSLLGNYPVKYRLFRLGYGLYRQFARRRYSESLDDRTFNILVKLLKMDVSTIEPFNNYNDLFMTSEVMDCLSYSIRKEIK